MRESTSWLTNHPHLAQALEQWRENTCGTEPDRHVQVKNGLSSARYPVELVESVLSVVREDLRGNEELLDVAVFSGGPSPHEDLGCRFALDIFTVAQQDYPLADQDSLNRDSGPALWRQVGDALLAHGLQHGWTCTLTGLASLLIEAFMKVHTNFDQPPRLRCLVVLVRDVGPTCAGRLHASETRATVFS